MSTINTDSTSVYADLGLAQKTDTTKNSNSLGQAEFLKLMTAQLKNQDPSSPMDSSQFLSQMAQFGTVNGIQELQNSFSSLSTAMQSSQALQASTLVGHSGLVTSSAGALGSDGAITGAVDLPSSVQNLRVNITGPNGELVKQLSLGIRPAGMNEFTWDGIKDDGTRAAPGTYSIEAVGNVGGTATSFSTLVSANIESVTLGKGGAASTVQLTGLGPVSISDIKQIR